jgi:hypothetical protein
MRRQKVVSLKKAFIESRRTYGKSTSPPTLAGLLPTAFGDYESRRRRRTICLVPELEQGSQAANLDAGQKY